MNDAGRGCMRVKAISILLVALFCGYGWGYAAQEIPTPYESRFLILINEARGNPLATAETFGLDTSQVLEQLPELRSILTQGLPSLQFNKNLYEAACFHCNDMIDNGYYSHNSADGRTTCDRIAETGYNPLKSGEILGILGFDNFIDPTEAVETIFRQMFLDELDPATPRKRNILNPEMKDVGVCLSTGTMSQGESSLNIYMMTCDFASRDIDRERLELELLALINDARRDPLRAIRLAGIDEKDAREALGDQQWILDRGLTPVALHERLREAARGHVSDMIERSYYDKISPEGEGPFDRVISTGYQALSVGETLGFRVSTDCEDGFEIVQMIFQDMLRSECDPLAGNQLNIFNLEATEVGIGFGVVALDEFGDKPANACVAVADFSEPLESVSYFLGNIYIDRNGNGSRDPGEGISGLRVCCRLLIGSNEGDVISYSVALGSYQIQVPPAFFEIHVGWDDDDIFTETVLFGTPGNQLRDIVLPSP